MRDLLAITKALSDASRVRLFCALARRGELCVCQLQELLELAPSTTSKHLSLLAAARLVEARKDGRWVHYRLATEAPAPGMDGIVAWVLEQAAVSPALAQDKARLDAILAISPEVLCQQQAEGRRCCSSAPATPAEAKWRKDGPGT